MALASMADWNLCRIGPGPLVLREVWLPGMREARAHRVPIRITGILGQALLDRASPVSCARRSREARDVVHGNGLPKV